MSLFVPPLAALRYTCRLIPKPEAMNFWTIPLPQQGGAGIKASQMLVDHGAKAIITYRCGDNAAQVLNAAKIEMYKAQDGSVSENIEKFKSGKLSLLSEIHPGLHNHGGAKE
jgi:predicted Fe-Mo cluster-binding NifX family protein